MSRKDLSSGSILRAFRLSRILVVTLIAGVTLLAFGTNVSIAKEPGETGQLRSLIRPCRFTSNAGVEPDAGNWKTWVLTSPDQIPINAPPYAPEEVAELIQLQFARTSAVQNQVAYWNTGGPAYRWNEIAIAEGAAAGLNNVRIARLLALMNVAIYDSTVAAWHYKYLHERPSPSACNPSLSTLVETPSSPSYPSEHAVAAGAASTILAYIFPAKAQDFANLADQAGLSRIQAGVNYRSDVTAGLALGKAVGALVADVGRTDGSNAVFTGNQPNGPCNWKGTNGVEPTAGTWRTWVISNGSEFRPPAPPACDSALFQQQLAQVRDFPRAIPPTAAVFPMIRAAYQWQAPSASKFWNDTLALKILEYGLDNNAPRSVRAYTLFHVAAYDATIAAWDAKYFYWHIRPSQFDPSIRTLFIVPNHPSYPSAHAIYDGSYAEVLSYLFPRDEAFFRSTALEAGTSRIWAGIHYQSDVDASLAMTKEIGKKVIDRAKTDGSQ